MADAEQANATIAGLVTGPDGAPAAGVTVTVAALASSAPAQASSASGGSIATPTASRRDFPVNIDAMPAITLTAIANQNATTSPS